MINAMKNFIQFLAVFFTLYILSAFISMEWNIITWHPAGRLLLCAVSIVGFIAYKASEE